MFAILQKDALNAGSPMTTKDGGIAVRLVYASNTSPRLFAAAFDDPSQLARWQGLGGQPIVKTEEEVVADGWTPLDPLPPARIALEKPAVTQATLRTKRCAKVDRKTDVLIDNGFTVNGKVFSASDAAQLKWLGIYTSREVLTYPLLAPTKDDAEFITLADEVAVVTFYTAIVNHVQDKLKSGILLKQQIAAAATSEALDAIVDNRT